MLLDQLGPYYVGVTCLQDIRWLGKGTLQKEGHKMFYSCDDKEHALAVGFVMRRRVNHLVVNFESYNPRICHLRIKGKYFNPLKTKDNMFSIRTQCVPRCKHSPLRL
jgi:hypothetical protein